MIKLPAAGRLLRTVQMPFECTNKSDKIALSHSLSLRFLLHHHSMLLLLLGSEVGHQSSEERLPRVDVLSIKVRSVHARALRIDHYEQYESIPSPMQR